MARFSLRSRTDITSRIEEPSGRGPRRDTMRRLICMERACGLHVCTQPVDSYLTRLGAGER
jgi:hypothetical protein